MIRKVIKKLFANKFIRWLLGVIGSYLLIAGIEALRTKINLGKSLINLPAKIINLLINIDIPLYILLLLVFLIWLILLKRERTYIGFSKVKKAELKKSLKEEYRVVLQHLIHRDHYGDHRSAVLIVYQGQYPNKGDLELGITLKELQRLGYITQENTGGGLFLTITDRACEKLSE